MLRKGLTLVEMLVAMAITLVMMAAVVTVFANVTSSVQKRRATIELNSQMRHVRSVLQRDLEGATCPALPWQRPESNHGYLEVVEGLHSDTNPSILTDGVDNEGQHNHELDENLSIVPQYGHGAEDIQPIPTESRLVQYETPDDENSPVVSTLNGLGDYDDILALTVRNEAEPFTGNAPFTQVGVGGSVRIDSSRVQQFADWGAQVIESPLAEVIWFAVENPDSHDDESGFFGEPGLRTIYRRTLLIAPWLAPYRYIDPETGAFVDTFEDGTTIRTEPGLLRVLNDNVESDEQHQALAALVAFQDRYDLSARVEWDPRLGEDGRWKIVANTLADLTKRENRYEHHYFHADSDEPERRFPFGLASLGGGYGGNNVPVGFVSDPELAGPGTQPAASGVTSNYPEDLSDYDRFVQTYSIDPASIGEDVDNTYLARPFAYVNDTSDLATPAPATVRPILNDRGQVVHLVHGPAPLWGTRRGEDVMLSGALGFDIRVFDPGAPVFEETTTRTVLRPGDPGWLLAYRTDMNSIDDVIGDGDAIGSNVAYLGQGAYVDMGYGLDPRNTPNFLYAPVFAISSSEPWFFAPRWIPDRLGNGLVPGYSVFDTWSFHYENNGLNEDNDAAIDEGTNGFDDFGVYFDPDNGAMSIADPRLGPDDIGERETTPPYDRPLRGIQVKLRGFEPDSQQIREVTVNQHFVPE